MFPTDQATAASSLPTPAAAGTQGFFTNGNPSSGVAATIVDADWLNMVQEELINVVLGGGIALSKTTYNQVLAAIKRICQNTTVLADTGAANAYTAANAVPLVTGTWIDGVVQAVKIAHANTGASTYAPDGLTAIPIYGLGLQPLQGGELYAGGTAILMHATISGLNSGNPICVLMECAGGAQQVAPATQSQHAPQMGQVAGVVGSVRNLAMNVATASASATMTADEIIVETALGGVRYCLPSFNKTINLATTGAGGMDTGSAPASSFVGIYAIYNPSTGTAALLAQSAAGVSLPNVYGGSNMPSGYTASALLAVWPTTSGSLFVVGYQVDRKLSFVSVSALSSITAQSSYTALSLANIVPKNARTVSGGLNASNVNTTGSQINVSPTATAIGVQIFAAVQSASAGTIQGVYRDLPLLTAQTLYYTCSTSTGSATYTISVCDYTI